MQDFTWSPFGPIGPGGPGNPAGPGIPWNAAVINDFPQGYFYFCV